MGPRWSVVVLVLLAVIVGWAVPVAATERVSGDPSPSDSAIDAVTGAADVFTTGVTTPRDADEGLW